MRTYILLENAEFFAHHGVMRQETLVGNVFIVNLKLEVDFVHAAQTDSIGDTISYADVHGLVKEEINKPSKLIEAVAYRILQRIRETYSEVKTIELKLSKQNPPIGSSAQVEYASVLLIDKK